MTEQETSCVRCDRPAGFNRVVVDTAVNEEIGGFCRDCEEETFGRVLAAAADDGDECLLCSRDGHHAIATWQSAPRAGLDDTIVVGVEYEVATHTPRLCDEHFTELCRRRAHPGQPRRGPSD